MQQSQQESEQTFGKQLHCAKRWECWEGVGILGWVVELQVGFSTCGLLLLPWEHLCAELVTQVGYKEE